MNFKIVEGHANVIDYDEIYDDFKNDYLDPYYSAKDLKEKYNLDRRDYKVLNNRVREDTGLVKKPSNHSFPLKDNTYIYKLTNCYGIRKRKGNDRMYFGYYPDMDTARMVRDKLVDNKWDVELGKELYAKYGCEKGNKHNVDLSELVDEFKHLYADEPNRVEDIMKKLKISQDSYSNLLSLVREKYPSIKKKCVRRESYNIKDRPLRYIQEDYDGKWAIRKSNKRWGRFENLQDAIKYREVLESTVW